MESFQNDSTQYPSRGAIKRIFSILVAPFQPARVMFPIIQWAQSVEHPSPFHEPGSWLGPSQPFEFPVPEPGSWWGSALINAVLASSYKN